MKMEQIECSESSAYIIQTPGNYPKENIIYSGCNLDLGISYTRCVCVGGRDLVISMLGAMT